MIKFKELNGLLKNILSSVKILSFIYLLSIITSSKIDTNKLNQVLLSQHNKYRKNHGVSQLTLDNELIKLAQDYSAVLAYSDSNAPSGNKNKNKEIVGENIYTCTSILKEKCYTENSSKPVDDWYSEIEKYNFTDPGFTLDTAHFTQIIWKETTKIGCGASVESDGVTYKVVCNYYKAGNIVNSTFYEENVLPPSYSNLLALNYILIIFILLFYIY